ncbi:MAG: translation initiation factor IF-1A [Candidatus Aenigmarchaeota archaeon]|nr:translation initiation factor IF-1A [Candidatus Aenigmarchaeota archaeon]MCK5042618.1 translation initiation factor IF-1A [Candidatus Aenigmarchaeota archaeon]MCK5062399.1 translation initiation factor IF-1A [Candidatus Aenigmarchaeota archaeon]MCK5234968.1 translation initiation factor IF-1A [Candidatus Aenigmarchaeota archaeon]MCK5289554.1 translation initiation factor IF-1A [Candidatus Aenigmarchaeota archaeon]
MPPRKFFKKKKKPAFDPSIPIRLRLPRTGEVLGVIDQRLGFGKTRVICSDKLVRVCRVPGKLRRSVSTYEGNFCIVRPWEVESDQKGDIIYTYTRHQAELMHTKGYLKDLES